MNDMKNESVQPIVSIITTTYKKFDTLENTIESVCSQDYPKIEYIISDDGSDNFERAKIEALIKKHKKDNIVNFLIIHQSSNLGTVKNINIATKSSQGKYVVGIGADDLFVNNSVITRIVDRMENEKCDVLSFTRIQKSQEGRILRKMPHSSFYKYLQKMDTPEKQYRGLVTGFYYEFASGSSICSKKSTLEAMGYYDEKFKFWEDGPYLAKCNRNGICIATAYDIDGIIYQLGGISSKKTKVESKVVAGLRDDAYLFYKNELESGAKILSNMDKRKIRYTLLRNRCRTRKKYLYMIMYLDVTISRFILNLKYKRADRLQ